MTQLFFFLLLLLFLLVTFLPLRTIIFLSLIYKFLCGLRWQNKRVINNKEVCRLELRNFLEERSLMGQVTDYDKRWDQQVTKTISVNALESKLTNHFQKVVRIYLPRHILSLCETPNEFIEYVGFTNFVIPLPRCDRNEIQATTNPRIKKRSTPLHYHLHNFIMSRIPSDIYKIRNPSLRVDKDDKGHMSVRLAKSQRLDKIAENTMSFIKHSFPQEVVREATKKTPIADF